MSASAPPLDSAGITRASRSNLAFAFGCLPPLRRRAMTTFYAFCRVVDDIADDPVMGAAEKRSKLQAWIALIEKRGLPAGGLEAEVMELLERYPGIDPNLLLEIIRGMEMDLGVVRYDTYEDLETYCYRVASAVGLVSIEIFGARELAARPYAIELGHALQLTNIIRDVGEDLRDANRIYLPKADMDRFGVTEEGLQRGQPGPGFAHLMAFEAQRAKDRFAAAARHFPRNDRKALRASELMRVLYGALLTKMERDGFDVLHRRYRLGAIHKLVLLLSTLLRG